MARKSLNKKGVEIQFNWIFILIIGVLILAFFVVMVQKQKEVANKKLAVNVLSEVDVILTGEGVATGRSDILKIPEMLFEFTCNSYSVAGIGRDTGNAIIFSPYNIQSDTLLTWTLSWNIPYKVANFLYLTTPDITYYFIDVDDFIADGLPTNVTIVKINSINDIEPQREDHIRIITKDKASVSGALPDKLKGLLEEELSALVIGDERLEFYKSNGERFVADNVEGDNSFPTLSDETLYGAIFTNRFEEYKCTMKKAVKRWEKVNEIYTLRTEFLAPDDITNPCWVYYAGTEFITIDQIISDGLQEGDTDFLLPTIRQLAATNDNTILASCPELY